jgi:mannose-6-phosphate isomerase-like protein (cupin superfamily)
MVSLLCDGLLARGIEVALFEIPGMERDANPCSTSVQAGEDPLFEVSAALRISSVFARCQDFDVIHNQAGCLPLTYASLVPRPVLTTVHGLLPQSLLPVYDTRSDKIYYVSTSDWGRLPTLSYLATIHPAVDLEALPFQEHPSPYLLVYGPIDDKAGIREAIDLAEATNTDLIIAGSVRDKDYFEREIKPRINGSRIRHSEAIAPESRHELASNALAILHLGEAFDFSVIEANACGTPAIAFRSPAAEEMIRKGQNGLLVTDLREAASAVKEIGGISRAACRNAIEQRFSASRMVDAYVRVYERIVSDTRTEERRPWGYYEVLCDEPDHKVKRIVVWPGKRLSLQRHRHRAEHWTVVQGEPIVTVDDRDIHLTPGDSIAIPLGARHRIANPGHTDVVFVEVQTGTSFVEHDIERFEDDFGRVQDKRVT